MNRIAVLDRTFIKSNPLRETYIVAETLGFNECSVDDLRNMVKAVNEFYRERRQGKERYTEEFFEKMEKRSKIIRIIEDEIYDRR